MPALRRATIQDARALAAVAERTFRDTFAAENTAEDMDLHCRTTYGEALQAAELADPDQLTLLCEADGALLGFAQLRWGPAPPCVTGPAPGEIRRLYVVRAWHGRGVAQTLMAAVLEALETRGCGVAWLGVWERNPRALAFCRKAGFMEVGDHVFPLGHDSQRDLILMKPLTTG